MFETASSHRQGRRAANHLRALPALLLGLLGGCNGNSFPQPKQGSGPHTYFVAAISSPTFHSDINAFPTVLSIDRVANTFQQAEFNFSGVNPSAGSAIATSGSLLATMRPLLALQTSYTFTGTFPGVTNPKPVTDAFALEIPGEGGFALLKGQPVAPFVSNVVCPQIAKPESFLFLSIPAPLTSLDKSSVNGNLYYFNLGTDTAYGTVSVSTGAAGSLSFSSVSQGIFPTTGATMMPPTPPAPPSQTGSCAPGIFGNVTNVPGTVMITNPGSSQTISPTATIGISPGGLLVENSGATSSGTASPTPPFANVLGAGLGTVGLPVSSSVTPSTLASAQFQGFFFNPGTTTGISQTSVPASFGFVTQPSSCPVVAHPTGSVLYGGDYPSNDPTKSSDGFGNCNNAIDLGVPDPTTNGLFPFAAIYPSRGRAYPAVAIAGQIAGKYAVFVLGVDPSTVAATSRQMHGIYLLQTN